MKKPISGKSQLTKMQKIVCNIVDFFRVNMVFEHYHIKTHLIKRVYKKQFGITRYITSEFIQR